MSVLKGYKLHDFRNITLLGDKSIKMEDRLGLPELGIRSEGATGEFYDYERRTRGTLMVI